MANAQVPEPRIGGGADGAPGMTVAEFFEAAIANEDIRQRAITLRQHVERVSQSVPEHIELQDVDVSAASLQALVLTHINGSAKLPEQQVIVEYLKRDQRLMIPSALGMSIHEEAIGRCQGVALLRERYLKLQSRTYAQLCTFITGNATPIQIREAVDNLELPVQRMRKVDWLSPEWFVRPDGRLDEPSRATSVFAFISQRLQFNCDIRDFGFLLTPLGSTTDGAFLSVSGVTEARLSFGLQAFTHQSIAALNYVPVGSYGLTAWARAYGVSIGLLPDVASRTVPEYSFTASQPPAASLTAIVDYQKSFERNMPTVCLNIIAMFGLLHLNKDHTYKTDDIAMERIGASYMNTLRTGVEENITDEMSRNKESVLRTCAHPFGLGQTYWLAQAMAKYNLLMAPLAIRSDICPPPVQRLMIVEAAASEWNGLPVGRQISGLYYNELEIIRQEILRVRQCPPAFSNLHNLYGCPQQDEIGAEAEVAIKTLMPAVFGYVNVTHVSERNERDGLAHAQSLKNVERESKGMVIAWKTAWEKYLMDLDKQGLQEFVIQIASTRVEGPAEPAAIRG